MAGQKNVIVNCHYTTVGQNMRRRNCSIDNLEDRNLTFCKSLASNAYSKKVKNR